MKDSEQGENRFYEFNGCFFDVRANKLFVGGEEKTLAPIASQLLKLLMDEQGKVVDKEAIIQKIWSKTDKAIDEDNVRQGIADLRRKLPDGMIETIRGVGYEFNKHVTITYPRVYSPIFSNPKPDAPLSTPGKKTSRRLITLKREALEKKLKILEKEHKKEQKALNVSNTRSEKRRHEKRIENIEGEIEKAESDLAALNSQDDQANFHSAIDSIIEMGDKPVDSQAGFVNILQSFQSFPEDLGNGIKLEMIAIPGGTFRMGSPKSEKGRNDDEGPQHQVTVSPFYLGKYQVTQAQWQAVMGTTVKQQRDKEHKDWPLCGEGNDYPMYYVSWDEAQEFCRRLSQQTGKTYRLPTEAEWEYACRAGSTGDYAGNLNAMAWYGNNSGSKMHPVGQQKANAFGLFDMHGNVWEWCQDWYGGYSSDDQSDPTGPAKGEFRVVRGGSWLSVGASCRSAYRNRDAPGVRDDIIGLRVVQSARTP
jgi:formylglycine-generating enzyme required for sulfatase activity